MDKLIVGLGNPGKKYKGSRHNLGFEVLDELSKEVGVSFVKEEKFSSEVADFYLFNSKIFLLKPLTFMNDSGRAVTAVKNYFDIRASDVWVAHDDIDLPFGKIRISWEGSSGGHKGVQSAIDYLGTQEFPRIKIGVGRNKDSPSQDWVLREFSTQEKKEAQELVKKAVEAIKLALEMGLEAAMNRFNS